MVDQVELRSELLELAERCEAATGPDRETDVEIALECAPIAQRLRNLMDGSPHNTVAEIAKDADRDSPHIYIPRYTASIDAAMTLVPKGYRGLYDETDGDEGRNYTELFSPDERPTAASCARTLALSICAAALRARTPTTPERSDG